MAGQLTGLPAGTQTRQGRTGSRSAPDVGLDATLFDRDGAFGRRFGHDAHGPPATHASERHQPTDQGVQGVIPAAAHPGSRVEMSATLADEDLARVDALAAEPLHTQPLCRGIAPVPAGRRALLVCHRQLFFPAAAPAFGAALLLAVLVFSVLVFSGLVFSGLAFAVLALAEPLFPADMPVIFTWVYRWR